MSILHRGPGTHLPSDPHLPYKTDSGPKDLTYERVVRRTVRPAMLEGRKRVVTPSERPGTGGSLSQRKGSRFRDKPHTRPHGLRPGTLRYLVPSFPHPSLVRPLFRSPSSPTDSGRDTHPLPPEGSPVLRKGENPLVSGSGSSTSKDYQKVSMV